MHKLKRHSITAAHITLITAMTVIGIIFIISYQINQSYKQTWASVKTVNNNILLTVINTLESNFKTIQLTLEDTRSKLEQIQSNEKASLFLKKNIFNNLSLYKAYGAEVILNEDGYILYASAKGLDYSQSYTDKDFFYNHKQQDSIGLFFGKPFNSRIDNRPSLPISIRYNKPDGSFGGVIVQTLKTDEINNLFSKIELGESSGLNLVSNKGTPIVLFPFDSNLLEKSLMDNEIFQKILLQSSGHINSVSEVDGRDRFYSFMSLDDYPFIIGVIQDSKAITREWREAAIWALVITTSMIIIIAGLVYLMYRQLKINRLTAIKIDNERKSFKTILEAIKDAVMVIDKHSNVIYLNPSAESITGASLSDSKGKVFTDLFSIFDEKMNQFVQDTNIHKALASHKFISAVDNRVLINKQGIKHPIEIAVSPLFVGNDLEAVVAVFHDVRNKRRQVNKMMYLAQHDSLTGLPNRRYLAVVGEEAIEYADANNSLVGLLFLDLDGFKNANDTLGHAGGDEILIQVTKRFKSLLRSDDTLVRNGGDEFIVLVNKLQNEQQLTMLAERLINAIQKEFDVFGRKINITTSVGISIYPRNASNLSDLIEYADQAMYKAKDNGRNCYHIYNTNSTN